MIELRPYQVAALERIRAAAAQGSRAVLAVSPTGSGKTSIASELVRRAVERGKRACWLAHRSELVDQAYDRLRQFGLQPGVISASSTRAPNPYARVQVASVQTLLARGLRPAADVLIWDEAHHAPSDLWSGIAQDYSSSILVGWTATPERSDGRGLGNVYTRIVIAARVRELVELGHLVSCDIRRPPSRLRPGTIAQRPVDAYRSEAAGRRAIVFSPSVAAAEAHASEFRDAGIDAAVVEGNTPPAERAQTLARFRSGALRVLVNVYVLTEGFDAPETDCVILARGCGTAGTYLQMVGRGLRPAAGKRDCILIDLHGVSWVHGHPEDDRQYSLEGRGIRGAEEMPVDDQASCRVCGAPIRSGEACAECGTEPKEIEPPSVANVGLVRYASKRAESEDERVNTAARWIAAGQAKGYKPGWWKAKYKAVYGDWPLARIEFAARQQIRAAEEAAA